MKDDRLYLGHIFEAVNRLLVYGKEGEEVFRFGVSLDIVWDVVRNHIPPLREKLARLVNG